MPLSVLFSRASLVIVILVEREGPVWWFNGWLEFWGIMINLTISDSTKACFPIEKLKTSLVFNKKFCFVMQILPVLYCLSFLLVLYWTVFSCIPLQCILVSCTVCMIQSVHGKKYGGYVAEQVGEKLVWKLPRQTNTESSRGDHPRVTFISSSARKWKWRSSYTMSVKVKVVTDKHGILPEQSSSAEK